jgi:hypothetical protein
MLALHPFRVATVLAGLIVMTVPFALAQEPGQVSEVALTMPGLRDGGDHDRAAAAVKAETKSKHATRKSAKAEKPPKAKVHKTASVVLHGTFEDHTAHYFDPLTLTLPQETRFDPSVSQNSRLDGSFTPADKSQIAIAPDLPVTNEITSAGIENMEKGNNHTIVVPLFQLLNKLSDQPPPQ